MALQATLLGGTQGEAEQHAGGQQDRQCDQQRLGARGRERRLERREMDQMRARQRRRLGGGPITLRLAPRRHARHGPVDGERCAPGRLRSELERTARIGERRCIERPRRLEAPASDRGDQDHAMRIGDDGDAGAPRPGRLDIVELHLDHDHAERLPAAIDPAREIQARPAADRAQREQLRSAALHRVAEIGPKAIDLADEAGRQLPVARRDRPAMAIDDVDHRGIGARGQQLERGVQPALRHRIAAAQRRRNLRILAEDQRQQPELLELARQQPDMRARGLPCHCVGRGARLARGPAAARPGEQQNRGNHRACEQQMPISERRSESHLCGLSHISRVSARILTRFSATPPWRTPHEYMKIKYLSRKIRTSGGP